MSNSKNEKEYTDDEPKEKRNCYMCQRDLDGQKDISTLYYQHLEQDDERFETESGEYITDFHFCYDCSHTLVDGVLDSFITVMMRVKRNV